MKKAYEQEIEMWNRVFEECIPVDLRNLDLKAEPMSFDGVILSNVLDVMPKDISTTVIDDLERVPEDSQQEAGSRQYSRIISKKSLACCGRYRFFR